MFEYTKIDPDQIEDIPVITTEQVYAKRIDFISDNLLYKAQAVIGSLPSTPVWRVVRVTINNDGDVTEEWADGNSNFDNVWNDRLTLTYI